MELFLITDNIDTATGMRLAGVESEVVASPDEGVQAIERAIERENTAVLIVSHSVAAHCREYINEVRRKRSLPLIVDLPGESEV